MYLKHRAWPQPEFDAGPCRVRLQHDVQVIREMAFVEAGDPAVGIGIVASALWLIKRDGELRQLAAPEHDQGAIERDVREAIELGRSRAQTAAEARVRAAANAGNGAD